MNDIVYGHLERAAESFAREDEDRTLAALMSAWQVCRSPALVRICEEFERRLVAKRLAVDEAAGPPLYAAWADTPRYLAWLLVPREGRSWHSLMPYLDAVPGTSPNPQLAPALVLLSRRPEFQEPRNLTKLCLALKHVGPPFDVAPLEALHASLAPDNDSAARLAFIIRMGREWVPPALDARAQAALQGLREALGARVELEQRRASVREKWLPQVYAQPDDDAARLVMADELVALGDPWGEFIVLQCSPAPDEARVNALLDAHRSTWEAPLGAIIQRGKTRFERGFPAAVWIGWEAPPEAPSTVPAPEWSMVREVDWGRGIDAEWLMHPHLRGIERVRQMSLFSAGRMGPHPSVSRVEVAVDRLDRVHLELDGAERLAKRISGWEVALARLALLPSLSWLEVREAGPFDIRMCANAPLGRTLERFDAYCQGAWRLTVRPSAEVPIEATLLSEETVRLFGEVLREAEGFGTTRLRVRCERKLKPWDIENLKQATAAYTHVIWE
ncbi:hypothetical protein LZ198_10450 [Myxococcus sp. K15C18031901]|uniref:hypothetical protein n=1 Tax=Myxococcus dinghuensis TaxID=2906761 RepID=UPI0020A77512|nr:hypothetical protein [Myxococcus dinghuensis]MCP3099291.1 hypothetical protein [Myxococcus dinghuensis]